jgi:hypothetical protein
MSKELDKANEELSPEQAERLKFIDMRTHEVHEPFGTVTMVHESLHAFQFAVQMLTNPKPTMLLNGRTEFQLPPPCEVAKYACDTAAALFKEYKARGWIVPRVVVKREENKQFGFGGENANH